jgi:hypothetical protein
MATLEYKSDPHEQHHILFFVQRVTCEYDRRAELGFRGISATICIGFGPIIQLSPDDCYSLLQEVALGRVSEVTFRILK